MIVPFPDVPRLALLDWDGTFCDSRKSIYEINRVMAEYYSQKMPLLPLPSYEEWLQVSHPGVEACMRSLGVTEERGSINAFFHRLLQEQREAGLHNPLYPDTTEFLEHFRARHVPMIVISRHLHDHLVQDIAAHNLTSFFDQIIGEPAESNLCKDVAIEQACRAYDVPNRTAFYLGDTSHDMRLAHQAGVCALAVSHGYDPISELRKESPAYIFGSLGEFLHFLSGK